MLGVAIPAEIIAGDAGLIDYSPPPPPPPPEFADPELVAELNPNHYVASLQSHYSASIQSHYSATLNDRHLQATIGK